MVCEKCGETISSSVSFCPSCGHSVGINNASSYSGAGNQSNGNSYSGGQYNNQSYQYPPYSQPYYQPAPAPAPTNGMAIAGFVCAFVFPILGIIFSCIGLSNAKKTPGQPNRSLAIAGIVISSVSLVIAIIWSIVFTLMLMDRIPYARIYY